MACLSDVVGIIDMDGFMVKGKFYCKELGLLKVGDATARSFFFDIGIRWSNLTAKDMPIRNVEGAEITVWCASGCKGKRDLRDGEYCQYVLPRGQTKRKLSFGI